MPSRSLRSSRAGRAGSRRESYRRFEQESPGGRLVDPRDAAEVIAFLTRAPGDLAEAFDRTAYVLAALAVGAPSRRVRRPRAGRGRGPARR
ncbi:hypothetical protein ACFZCT_27885 [Streptomyces qaidamensis]|uniref:hypothetical protein n=1 Tax=Streptomyces qaidamensis TaxID=1783515 RepID=UPI0036E846EC